MCFVPLSEGRSVDLDNGGFRKGIGAHKFVVGGMERHIEDANFASDAFGAPGEIAGVDAEGTEFLVAAADADEMDALGTDTGVGWLTAFLEGSAFVRKGVITIGDDGVCTASCDSRNASRPLLSACDESLVRYP